MPDFDGAVITARVDSDVHSSQRSRLDAARLRIADLGMWPRMATVIVLSAVAYGVSYGQIVADAIDGSRTAYLVVVPVLAALIAFGYRSAPRGVGDTESDWIIAALSGLVGMSMIHLLSTRVAALAGLWRLQLLEVVVWFACAVAVMFGVRQAVRMWGLWLFAVCCATPLPFLLVSASLGGSDLADATLTAALGAIAVFLAGRFAPIGSRVGAAVGCFVVAAAFVRFADSHLVPLVVIVIAGGLVPVLATAALARVSMALKSTDRSDARGHYPAPSPTSLGVLCATAIVLLVVTPATAGAPAQATVSTDWARQAGLSTSTSFPFITGFLGPTSSLDRYTVPGGTGLPMAAVDVMTTTNPAALEDFADAVWYPVSRPLDYTPAEPASGMPPGARVIHTDPDTATDRAGSDWYAVTWTWRSGDTSQRVTVIVSQTVNGDQPPPPPRPLSLANSALRPAMWVARQQPEAVGEVDPRVIRRAAEVVNLIVPHHVTASETPPVV